MKRFLMALLLSSVSLFADGTVRQSITQLGSTNSWVLSYTWTGDASTGTVPITAASLTGCNCQGYLFTQVEVVPASPAPTAGYSVSILDSGGADILDGAAASLSASSTQSFAAAASATPLQGTFRLSISGQSVAAAKGTVYVFLSKPGTVNLATIGRGGGATSTANWLTIANPPIYDIRRYNWTPLSPGGSIAIGSNTITLSPCPTGISALSVTASAPVRIFGGTGAEESPPITAFVASGNTCRITFIALNTHTGAWKAGPTFAGAQEAIIAAGNAIVLFPAGITTYYGTLISPFGASLRGAGSYNTFLRAGVQSIDAVHILGAGGIVGEIRDLRLDASAATIADCQHGAGLVLDNNATARVGNVDIDSYDYGIKIQNGATPYLKSIDIRKVGLIGLVFNLSMSGQSGVVSENLTIQGWGPTTGTPTGIVGYGTVAGALFSDTAVGQIYGGIIWQGVINEIQMTNTQLDAIGVGGGYWFNEPRGFGGNSHKYTNTRIAGAGTGIMIDSGWTGIQFVGGVVNVNGPGVAVNGARNVQLVGMNVVQAYSLLANNAVTIAVGSDAAAASDVKVDSCVLGFAEDGSTGTYAYQTGIFITAAAHGNLMFTGNRVYGFGNPLTEQGTGTSVTHLFQGNWFSGAANSNTAGGSTTVQFVNNVGADLAVATVASITSSTITLPATHENTILVSADGSGGVTTITAPNGTQWTGRTVRIAATNASGIVFNTGGNIRAAKTLTVGQSALATWDGSLWDVS